MTPLISPLHAKWSSLQNTQQKSTKFSGMLGGDGNIIQEKFDTKTLGTEKIEKRLLSGSGETKQSVVDS